MTASNSSKTRRILLWIGIFVCVTGFIYIASDSVSEITDDAFISFRYAKHLAEGKGLVFNEGERVEGYTNFLWTLIMALGYSANAPLPLLSQALSLFCAAVLVISVALFSGSFFDRVPFPSVSYLAPLLLCVNPVFLQHVKTGLETILFGLLTFLGLIAYLHNTKKAGIPFLTGFLLGLAYLTRPEAAMWVFSFVLVDVMWIALKREKPFEGMTRIAQYSGIFTLMVLTHLAWRFSYYGELLPNTYYVKSISNFAWGMKHTKDFLRATGYLPVIALVAGPIFLRGKWIVCMTTLIVVLGFYNLRMGGDFIFTGRFLLPLLPCVYLIISELIRRPLVSENRRPLAVVLGAVFLALFLFGAVREYPSAKAYAIENQRTNDLSRFTAECFSKNSDPSNTIACIGVGIMPYYLDRKIIDMAGLNDKHIARFGLVNKDCLVGHQRADSDYVIERRPRFILVGPDDPMAYTNAALRDMLANPKLPVLYKPVTVNFRGAVLDFYVLKTQPLTNVSTY